MNIVDAVLQEAHLNMILCTFFASFVIARSEVLSQSLIRLRRPLVNFRVKEGPQFFALHLSPFGSQELAKLLNRQPRVVHYAPIV